MSKIFIVTNGTYSDYSIQAVFSDREKAEKYLAELKLINDDNADIEEWDVDTTDELVAREYWSSKIDLTTGEFVVEQYYGCDEDWQPPKKYYWGFPNQRVVDFHIENDQWNGSPFDRDGNERECYWMKPPEDGHSIITQQTLYSFVSQEHADKLAVEARQRWLRNVDLNNIVQKYKGQYYYSLPSSSE
jgi:hypothetical protein